MIITTERIELEKYFCWSGKLQKDRRKMREKRRSTGVVYLASREGNESNGTTTCEEEEEGEDEETVKNTKQNEISNTDGRQTNQIIS